jgi:hypothetical protein
MMARVNKYIYGWKLYVNYGQGWEYEVFESSWKDAKQTLKEYRENCPQYPIKASRGRELNPEWSKQNVIIPTL